MSAASNYTENNFLDALLRGQTFQQASTIYVALHTSDPGDGGGGEVTTGTWPAYQREDAATGGAIDSGWTAPSNGVSYNAKQIAWPTYDGSGDITITHWSLHDAASGGNMLVHGSFITPRTLSPNDVFIVDVNKLTVQQQ